MHSNTSLVDFVRCCMRLCRRFFYSVVDTVETELDRFGQILEFVGFQGSYSPLDIFMVYYIWLTIAQSALLAMWLLSFGWKNDAFRWVRLYECLKYLPFNCHDIMPQTQLYFDVGWSEITSCSVFFLLMP